MKGYKCESIAGTKSSFTMPPWLIGINAAVLGLACGYPPCCVAEFVDDVMDGRLPGIRRGSVTTGRPSVDRPGFEGVYVPCSRCCAEMGRTVYGA